MNVRNITEKPEKMEKKVDAPEEKGEKKDSAKTFGKYFAAGAALVAALALPACGMDPMGRRTIDIDAVTDASNDNTLEGIEDTSEMDEESDVPEEVDVPDVEMDAEEDTIADVEEEDVVEDTAEDVSEDSESEDAVEEDVSMDTSVDTESDTGVDTITDTVDATDVSVDDVSGGDVVVSCDTSDASRLVSIHAGSTTIVGGVGVRYNGTDTSGNAVFDILCDGTAVRSDIHVASGATVTEDLGTFSVTLNPRWVSSSGVGVDITVNDY